MVYMVPWLGSGGNASLGGYRQVPLGRKIWFWLAPQGGHQLKLVGLLASLLRGIAQHFALGSPLSGHLVQGFTIQQITLERLDYFINLPFWAIDVLHQVLDAVPAARTVKLAILTFIKELTVLLADVLLVLAAMPDLHRPLLAGLGLVDRRLPSMTHLLLCC
jgi:hypothetical protein